MFPQQHHIDGRVHNVLAFDQDLTHAAGTFDQVVHPVERPQKSTFPAAGRANQRGHRSLGNGQGHIKQDLMFTIIEIEAVDLDRRWMGRHIEVAIDTCDGRRDRTGGNGWHVEFGPICSSVS